ncbi:septal ring lytic transglycosylase RlpA family protein [uncultured Pontibacter sp.]|uniref:septal ring lytic transglycosylase RlpA family protein n=1 Tax=uncultured Pontibacter sp. TaxID=453356 RepID=UPI0026364DA9|nr:septal ring lytic transglycosylase RlpA family protein [uncultured Pontibacter sp.]
MRLHHTLLTLLLVAIVLGSSSCTTSKPTAGQRGYTEEGKASYYSNKLHGRKMANGQPYNRHRLTAAHRTLPFGTKVKVTNLQTNKTVKLKITDRGPFVKGRVIDLSEAAAKRLDYLDTGIVPVKVKVIKAAPSR